jgi:hypothetical protein
LKACVNVTLTATASSVATFSPVATLPVHSSTLGDIDFNIALKFFIYFLVNFSVSFLKYTTVGSSNIFMSIFQLLTAFVSSSNPLTRFSLTDSTSFA